MFRYFNCSVLLVFLASKYMIFFFQNSINRSSKNNQEPNFMNNFGLYVFNIFLHK